MIATLFDHLWQSTVFAVAAGLLAAAHRSHRAGLRYGMWLTASVKFLVPFAWLMSAGSQFAWSRSAAVSMANAAPAIPAMSQAINRIAQPFSGATPVPVTVAPGSRFWIPVILSVWLCGLAAIIVMRLKGWQRVRAALRASTPLTTGETRHGGVLPVRSSPILLEPGVVGWWRPVLLMPEGIEAHLTPEQLDAVLAHELCHVRRHDNLTSAIHMIVEAAFWFHPLVWWIGARLVDERESACDEYVLRVCGTPRTYAEGIVAVCKRYTESPVACVAGVTGSDLKRRIAHILTNRIGLRLNMTRRLALAMAVLVVLVIPVIAGAVAVPLRAQSLAQPTIAKFDVVSVKQCPADGGPAGRHIDTSLHRAYFECFTIEMLLDVAYAKDGNFTLNASPERNVHGGPDWIRSEQYTVEGKTASPDSSQMGAMLRALFEDRFQLRTHKAVEQVAMYALTVAKGGLKIKPIAPGDCVEDDSNTGKSAAAAGGKPFCGMQTGRNKGTTRTWELGGMPLSALADLLDTDRKVLDQTHVPGLFNIHLEYERDEMTTTGVTVFAALEQQLGLKLVPTKGPHEYFVVDHIERPKPD